MSSEILRLIGRRLAFVLAACGGLLASPAAGMGAERIEASDAAAPSDEATAPLVLVVLGASGTDAYEREFAAWAERWKAAAEQGGADFALVGADAGQAGDQRARLEQTLAEVSAGDAPLWLVLIGHGTFDQRAARFNLQGPDVSAQELAQWLLPVERPLAVINCSSSSGPFLKALAHPERVVITATRSGSELNFARFGDHLSRTVADPAADLDKDGQTSLLEAFLMASRGTANFYETEARLATEHALIDDNGDGAGTPADWFRGIRVVKKSADGVSTDGHRAHQWHLVPSDRERGMPAEWRAERDRIELEVITLRDGKQQLDETAYYAQLETLLLLLAALYEQAEPAAAAATAPSSGDTGNDPPAPDPPEDP